MTHEEVAVLKEGDVVNTNHCAGRIVTTTDRFVKVEWITPKKPRPYDVLYKRSPIWLEATKI